MNNKNKDLERGCRFFDINTPLSQKNITFHYLNQSGLIANSNKSGTKP